MTQLGGEFNLASFLVYFVTKCPLSIPFLNFVLLQTSKNVTKILTTATLMPTVRIPKVHSTARAMKGTRGMELFAQVS